MPEYLS